MNKLKKVFSPGKDTDDETMYNNTSSSDKTNSSAGPVDQGVSSASNTQPTHPEHGQSRQLDPEPVPITRQEQSTLDSRMGAPKEDNGVKRQVLDPESSHPGSNHLDESGYGATGFTGGENRKPNELGSVPASHENYEPAGAAFSDTTRPTLEQGTPGSGLSMKSGVAGLPNQQAEERALRSDGVVGQDTPPQGESSNFGRNAALAGAGAAAGAGGAYAATRHGQTPRDENIQDTTHTDRSFPLRGGAIAGQHDKRPTSSVYSADAPGASAGPGPSNLTTTVSNENRYSCGDAARASVGLARHSETNHQGHTHEFQGDPCESGDGPKDKTLPFVPGPHSTVAANMFDPHVPGEFPTEDGIDPHVGHNTGGFGQASQPAEPSNDHSYGRDAALAGGAGAAGLGAHEALKDRSSSAQQPTASSTTSPITSADQSSSDNHHYGRNAALAGGAGAAGLGAYAATRDRDTPVYQPASASESNPLASGSGYPAPLGSHEAMEDRSIPTQQPSLSETRSPLQSGSSYPTEAATAQPSEDHHYGRNATLASGAGAAGLGAYAATRDRSDPTEQQTARGYSDVDPSSQQTGSSQSFVKSSSPQHVAGNPLTGQKESQGTSPQNVTGNPLTGQREPQNEHHYGRDAALAGGAGAAGYGAYQYSQNRGDTGLGSETTAPRESNVGASNDPQQRNVSDPVAPQEEKEHHYGHNAALAGGAGAAGYGAYQYSKDRNDPEPAARTAGSTIQSDPYSSQQNPALASNQQSTQRTAAPVTESNPYSAEQNQTLAQNDPKEHHYGRNAALAGGAGAAGVAGYSALQNDRDTGPASKTIGPHESNAANIVDPRVRPEPEKMKEHTTSGPWQSDTLNKMDPKVESDPSKADVKAHGYASGGPTTLPQQAQQQQQQPLEEEKDNNYGRNAALAGGAAAGAGAAAYGVSQADDKREQEKLAKEQEKQAKHDAKEQQKEADKQAKHDAKEQDKQAKHDAKEQQKVQEKQAKHDAKEQEKLDKQHAKEQEKLEKQRSKDADKAEEKRAKEAEKDEEKRRKEQELLEKEKEKENDKLVAARDEEADKKHREHNKLHKTPPEEREDKGGIFHRIFHHKRHSREGVDDGRASGSFEEGERPRGLEGEEGLAGQRLSREGQAGQEGYGQQSYGQQGLGSQGLGGEGDGGVVTEKTTGLPMNVGEHGSGAGGTDGGQHIAGYHAK